jgi:O-succinylbenzoic acid--CoA ligase
MAVEERLGLEAGDRWLASLSPAHVGGLALITRAALLGSCVVVRDSLRPSLLAELIDEGAITHASLVPTMLHQLLEVWGGREVPQTLRCLLIGGAAAPETLVERALGSGFPVALTYGLTEASSQVATAPPESVRKDPRSVGSPLPGIEVRSAADGELLVRGDTVARVEADSDGWLHTGDLGEVDGMGRIRLRGRRSDRIISGGENVDPQEVEALLRVVPGVVEVAVVGVPDEKWGERVVAAVVSSRDGDPTEEELAGLVRTALSPAKRPRNFVFLDALPLNANGKVDRAGLRRLFQPS